MPRRISAAPNRINPNRSSASVSVGTPSLVRIPLIRSPPIPLNGSVIDEVVAASGPVPVEPVPVPAAPADVGQLPLLIHPSTVAALFTRCSYCAPPIWQPTHRSYSAEKLPAACAPVEPEASLKPPRLFSVLICCSISDTGLPVTRKPKLP